MRTSALIHLLVLLVACAPGESPLPPPQVSIVPTADTGAPPQTTPTYPGTTSTDTAVEPWSDPAAVWDCPAPGTICRYAGGGSILDIPLEAASVDTRTLGGAFRGLASVQDSGLLAITDNSPSDTIVALGATVTTVLWWPSQSECVDAGESFCGHVVLDEAGANQVFTSWIANFEDIGSAGSGLVEVDIFTGEETVRMGGEHAPDVAMCAVGQPAVGCSGTYQTGVALADGSLAIADRWSGRVWIVDPTGIVVRATAPDKVDHPIEGSYSFDALPTATPVAVAVHGTDLYIADAGRGVIWSVDTETWLATWFAGTLRDIGVIGGSPYVYAGDDGPAIDATFDNIRDMMADDAGQIYVGDSNLVRVVGADGIIRRFAGVAGDGQIPDGDGGPATDAQLGVVDHLVLHDGYLYFVDWSTVRRVWLP